MNAPSSAPTLRGAIALTDKDRARNAGSEAVNANNAPRTGTKQSDEKTNQVVNDTATSTCEPHGESLRYTRHGWPAKPEEADRCFDDENENAWVRDNGAWHKVGAAPRENTGPIAHNARYWKRTKQEGNSYRSAAKRAQKNA